MGIKLTSMGDALFTRTQRQVLSLLFGNPDRSFYSNEIVRLADNASYSQGTHSVSWNSMTANGTPAAAGVYIYELRSGNVSKTAKMILVK